MRFGQSHEFNWPRSSSLPRARLKTSKRTSISTTDTINSELGEESSETSDEKASYQCSANNSALVEVDPEYGYSILWCGSSNRRMPFLNFSAELVMRREPSSKHPSSEQMAAVGQRFHLTYKFVRTECRLVRMILNTYGFHESHATSLDFNLMWTGSHVKPYVLRSLQPHQKVNHFPRTYEITHKDLMFKNIQRMQHVKGVRHFDFVPQSYVMPGEYSELCAAFHRHQKEERPTTYIVKPVALSRGRGIFLCTNPEQISLEVHQVVSAYIGNPYLIDGFKFDLRIYVAVTSFDPLVVYMFEEGLARFATVKYGGSNCNGYAAQIRNPCMHLTNYSVNKKSQYFVQNQDPEVEDFGNKWSLGALLRYLESQGHDIAALVMRLQDVVVKALLSVETAVGTACNLFEAHRGNCYELFGFDILLDENLRPWLLEVNLSPSLACDSPLDLKVKCHMLCDLFTLVGVLCHDPVLHTTLSGTTSSFREKLSASPTRRRPPNPAVSPTGPAGTQLTAEEARMIQQVLEEEQRRGGWVRVHPTKATWELYGAFLQSSSVRNLLLHQKLYPDHWRQDASAAETHLGLHSSLNIASKVTLHSLTDDDVVKSLQQEDGAPGNRGHPGLLAAYELACANLPCYIRKLNQESSTVSSKRPPTSFTRPRTSSKGTSSTTVMEKPRSSKSAVRSRRDSVTEQQHPQGGAPRVHSIFKGNLVKPELTSSSASLDLSLGAQMSRYQARIAFSAYLNQVRKRFLEESASSSEKPSKSLVEVSEEHQQVELLLRFLRHASAYLNSPLSLATPSLSGTMPERKRVLAHWLAEFVSRYDRETEQLQEEGMNSDHQETRLKDEVLAQVLASCDECQLELFLAHFSQKHQSSSGLMSPSFHDESPASQTVLKSVLVRQQLPQNKIHTLLDRRTSRPKSSLLPDDVGGASGNGKLRRSLTSLSLQPSYTTAASSWKQSLSSASHSGMLAKYSSTK